MSTNLKHSEVISILLFTWAAHFFVDLMIGIWSVFKTIAGVDLALAGIIAAICPFIGEGMQIVFGQLGDKGYRKVLFLLGLAATTASAFLPLGNGPIAYFVLFMITCLGSGAFHPSAVAITSSLTKNRRALFVTFFASGGYLGLALSQIAFSEIYFRFNGATEILAVPSLVLICITLIFGFHGKGSMPSPPGKRFGFQAFKKLFASKELVTLYCMQVFNQSIYWGTIFLLPDILSGRGYEKWIAFGGGHLFLILGAGFIAVPGGYLADRHSARKVLLAANALGACFFFLFLAWPTLPPQILLLLLFFLGASMGVTNPVAVALGNQILPSRPGLVSAFLMGLVWCIAEGIGPGGGGLLTKLFTEHAPAKALAILGTLFFFSYTITLRLPKDLIEEYDLDTN